MKSIYPQLYIISNPFKIQSAKVAVLHYMVLVDLVKRSDGSGMFCMFFYGRQRYCCSLCGHSFILLNKLFTCDVITDFKFGEKRAQVLNQHTLLADALN